MVKLGKASVVPFAHFVQGWQGTDPRPDQELRFSPGFQPNVYPTADMDMLVSKWGRH